MKVAIAVLSALVIAGLLLLGCTAPGQVQLQQPSTASTPVQGDRFRTQYIRLGSNDAEGLLYEPLGTPPSHIALVYSHPNSNTFNEPLGREMASRGYRVLMVNYRGAGESDDAFAPSISRGIAYLRSLQGVRRVVIVGHSGGGHLVTFYQNVAEHGPSVCQGAEKIFPCSGALAGLQKPDGIVLLDPTLGAFHQMSSVDPAVSGAARDSALDMFAAEHGFDSSAGRATYSPEFASRFYAAQSARNTAIVNRALERLQAIREGKGEFSDDEPLVIAGMGVQASGARLYQPDTSFLAQTKRPHLLLRSDGTEVDVPIRSVRPPSGRQTVSARGTLNVTSQNTTVRKFLAASAIRTTADYSITADDIVGVDWASAITSTPANAAGVSVPALVLVMSCHYLVVPGEIIFDRLGSRDKQYAAVEGATHLFAPCRPEFGNTMSRTFDFVAGWLRQGGRFTAVDETTVPYIDAHSHIATAIAPDEVIARLRRAGLAGVVIMHPDPPALHDIARRNAGFVTPFISVARTTEATGLRLNDDTATAFASLHDAGAVCGFGEIPTRLVPNPEPGDAAALSNRYRGRIFDLADTRGVPVNIHVSLETPEVIATVESIAASHPRMPLVLAHAGWMAGANVIGPLLKAHPNLYVDLSVRLDPAVGGVLAPGAVNQQSILTPAGRLQPEWRALIESFPDRFLFGLDVTGSDRPQHIDELVAVARHALGELPRDVEAAVAHGNTERLLRACNLK